METLSIRPLSVFSISSCKKLRNSSFSLSCKAPPNRSTLKSQYNYNPPTNPFCFCASALLHTIKDIAFTRRWASPSRDSVELDQFPEIKDDDYLRGSSGIGMALLSTTMAAKVHISPFLATLAANPTFISGLLVWAVAQIMKVFLNFYVERKWDLRILFSCGGMPSSHSALCMALTTSVALCHGVGDSLFPVCLGFSLIVMYDAIGVRRHAGMQAEVLNLIIEDLFQWHPISQRKLKELLGHTPSQVIAGAILGILVACFCCQGRFIAS